MRTSLFFTLFFLSIATFGQELSKKGYDINSFIEALFPFPEEDVNYEELYETYFLLHQNPLNLNNATPEELRSLYILSDYQIKSFFNYLSFNGHLISIYELQAIPGFDLHTIKHLLPFIEVKDPGMAYDPLPLFKRITSEKNNLLLLRYERTLEMQKGYTAPDTNRSGVPNQRYIGSPDKLYARFRVSHPKDFSLGFTMEKDAGEKIYFDRNNNAYGMDFYSYHFLLQNKGRLKNFIAGDYQIQVGQSLLLGAGFIVGKGSETVNTTRRPSIGIRPYTSVVESGFFRGAAYTVEAGNFLITNFYSYNKTDGNIVEADSLSENPFPVISSIYTTGYHRTPNEIAAKNSINEQVTGGNITYKSKNKNFDAGVTFIATFYNKYLQRNPQIYNQYEFSGSENFNLGSNFSYNWQNFNFFGEGAVSKSGGKGLVSGFVASFTSKLDAAMVFRHYDRNFHSFYGRAFGENSRNINEQGTYLGLKFTPISKVFISAYYDHFHFPWLKYRVDAPSHGHEYLLRLNYVPSKKILLYAQLREKGKEMNMRQDNLNILTLPVRRNYIFNLDYTATNNLTLKSRVQASTYSVEDETTNGFVILQDVGYDWGKCSLNARVALFDTDNFQNRQYVYEKDVLYAFSIPFYDGLGTRSYVLLNYKLTGNLQLWARYSRTSFRNKEVIGSGLEQIEGNNRTNVKFQVMMRL